MNMGKELRDRRVSGVIRDSLYKEVEKVMLKNKWSLSDCIEEGLTLLTLE